MVELTSFGTPPRDQRAITLLLKDTLGLDDFLNMQDLESIKTFLSEFSARIKAYSVSGTNRIPDQTAVQIVADSLSLHSSMPLLTVNPAVENAEFTFCSWVRSVPVSHPVPLLRKPLPKDPDLSCWGWYYPSQFRYGAHDYHTSDTGGPLEVTVDAEEGDVPEFSHEAVVARRGILTFYRNGQQIGSSVVLPRPITNCLSTVQLGSAGLEMSSTKFYPRALMINELADIYAGGAPLSEIATSSVLQVYAVKVEFVFCQTFFVMQRTFPVFGLS